MEDYQNTNNKKMKRLSEREMAMRRTTLPLHSFLTKDELSLYYILDRLPVRNRFGIGDRNEVAVIQKIMGCSQEDTGRALDGLVRLGIIYPPGTDTTWMESVINFPVLFDFCTRLGQHPLGFGGCLRNVTGFKDIREIGPREYGLAEKAYRALEQLNGTHTHVHADTGTGSDIINGQDADSTIKSPC